MKIKSGIILRIARTSKSYDSLGIKIKRTNRHVVKAKVGSHLSIKQKFVSAIVTTETNSELIGYSDDRYRRKYKKPNSKYQL